ncbi:copper-containing nitrite reductase [Dyella lutea]|uniref:Copper-containing nitrite reductase n=1 Tax=Dyella lutea TaxID=2950441 RepID=A0ABT1FBI4_9GAMM|nr:copper-containing nitrite reductase [Dyella lutea]MCP1374734.1 copper-containing nitrite reductase [Dyella lutea]
MNIRRMLTPAFALALAWAGFAHATTSNLQSPAEYTPTVTFTLKTDVGAFGMGFRGVGGAIDGQLNPTLKVPAGAIVQINLIDGDGSMHNLRLPDFNVLSNDVVGKDASTAVVFRADHDGSFDYFCNIPGHRAAGMDGKLVVGKAEAAPKATAADISRAPDDLPPPVGDRAPKHLEFNLTTEEVTGQLANGTTFTYWTFNGKVPGPMLRARVGDTVTVSLHNDAHSLMNHSVDMHAVTGPGGGAAVMQVPPGQTRSFTFKALKPGLYVYHCATPMVAQHIANGMYGMVLVEPADGLPKVAHEFYVMQGEIYTTEPFNTHGHLQFDVNKLLAEQPTYMVFNGAVGALTTDHPLKAKVGDTVRIYFGVGGPNKTSSFHLIGEMFDDAWAWGALANRPEHDVQTISVPPGGAVVTDVHFEEPGKYILVDHALSRLEKGLAGWVEVTGPKDPSIFRAGN